MHKVAAVGVSSLMAACALTPAALAAGSARVRTGVGVATLPNTSIKGSPAHWSPKSLTAKARSTSTTCTSSQASFTITNKKRKSEKATFSGPGIAPTPITVAAKKKELICVTKGFTGTVKGKLKDGKTVKVHFV